MSISTEGLDLHMPESIDLFNRFGPDHDRFLFPGPICRVTGGHGGEAILILGSSKNVLIDCGMAYAAAATIDNIRKVLDHSAGGTLDYILLSHSHYDHMGALPYIRKAFPKARVFGSSHCARVLEREGARKLIKELGENARDLYDPEGHMEIITQGIGVDVVLEDGSCLYIGHEEDEAQYIQAYETPGHTNCSMSYMVQPLGLLFSSESTGILEGDDYVHTPCLKSFIQGVDSANKCRNLEARDLCLPHFGMVPRGFGDGFWDMFIDECRSKTIFVSDMVEKGLSGDEMLALYMERYWTSTKEAEQPREAFEINSRHILKALINELEDLKNIFRI